MAEGVQGEVLYQQVWRTGAAGPHKEKEREAAKEYKEAKAQKGRAIEAQTDGVIKEYIRPAMGPTFKLK